MEFAFTAHSILQTPRSASRTNSSCWMAKASVIRRQAHPLFRHALHNALTKPTWYCLSTMHSNRCRRLRLRYFVRLAAVASRKNWRSRLLTSIRSKEPISFRLNRSANTSLRQLETRSEASGTTSEWAFQMHLNGKSIAIPYSLGGLDRDNDKLPQGFKRELGKLITLIGGATAPIAPVACKPIYDFRGLEIAMRDAIDAFRSPWRARLGLSHHENVAKEHWTRIKALSRRLANNWGDEYGNLRPIADLLSSLQEEASKWLDRPAAWTS